MYTHINTQKIHIKHESKNRAWGKEGEASRGEMQVGKRRKLNEGEYDHRHEIFERNCFYEVQCYMWIYINKLIVHRCNYAIF